MDLSDPLNGTIQQNDKRKDPPNRDAKNSIIEQMNMIGNQVFIRDDSLVGIG